MINPRCDVVLSTKDRHSELCILLTSLLHQTFKDWDLIIVDDSQTPIGKCEAASKLLNLIKLQNHRLVVERASTPNENCKSRQQGADLGVNPYILRMDDDTFFAKNDDLQKLMTTIIEGNYDAVGAVTPPVGMPEWKREIKFVKPVINKVIFDEQGNISIADDCGYSYLEDEVLPAHHLRSSFIYKRSIHEAGVKFDVPGRVAFREETKFCLASAWRGFNKFAVVTGVKFHHLHTSSGGCRLPPQDYNTSCLMGDEVFKAWCKRMWMKYGNPFEVKQ